MASIIITPKTELGKEKIKEHYLETSSMASSLKLRRRGIKQVIELPKAILTLEFIDLRVKMLEKHFPEQLMTMIDANKEKLIGEMLKMGLENTKDYTLEVRIC